MPISGYYSTCYKLRVGTFWHQSRDCKGGKTDWPCWTPQVTGRRHEQPVSPLQSTLIFTIHVSLGCANLAINLKAIQGSKSPLLKNYRVHNRYFVPTEATLLSYIFFSLKLL